MIVGENAGRNIGAGSGNTFLGYNAGYNETGSNKLYIENSTSATPLIWGDFNTDRIGINRVATTNTLEVGGDASKSTAGNWLANSDARLKKDLRALDSEEMLNKMLALRGITYFWNDTVTNNPRPTDIQYGFTAQNIQEVFPILVTEDNQGFLQTPYGTYDAMMVEAIRALNNRIEAQKEIILQLESQVSEVNKMKLENDAFQASVLEQNKLLYNKIIELESLLLPKTNTLISED